VYDEYYALVAGDPKRRKEVEVQISLLGAKARAAGIHLILATQQPSREVVKGALDSNIPGRVGLMMVKGEESRMLLGHAGAENLLGKGDLLFRDIGDPVRLQAPLVSDPDLRKAARC
jgi:S-DNA-T family DNA segregation ATPase FtsK/SpoIIIE